MSLVTRASIGIPRRICETSSSLAPAVAWQKWPAGPSGVMDGGKARRFPNLDSTYK